MKYRITLTFNDENGDYEADSYHEIEANTYQQAIDTAEDLMVEYNVDKCQIEEQ